MTKEKNYFIKLLSSFLNQTEPEGEKVDFGELFRLADIHDVGGIITTQLKTLDAELQPEGELRSYFNQVLGYTVKNNVRRENAYCKVRQFLSDNEIEHIFVKGIILRNYYPVPELRTSGDIDVIVKADLDKIKKLALDNGIKIKDFVSETLTLSIDELDIEIHNKSDVVSNYFDDIFSLCEQVGFEYKLSEYDHLFYVLCHLIKHLIYRGAGVRMLLDVDVMIRHITDFDENILISLSSESGVEKAVKIILSLCKLWFNTPINSSVELADTELLNRLEAVFLSGGSFGYETNSIPIKYFEQGSSKLTVILKMAFPTREYLKKCYPYYKNNSLLLPVARVNRLLDGVFKKNKLAKKVIRQDVESSAVNSQLLLINDLELNIKE